MYASISSSTLHLQPTAIAEKTNRLCEQAVKKANNSIAHAIPGRVRFYIPEIAADSQFIRCLKTPVPAHPVVKNERVNQDAASIVLKNQIQILQNALKRVQSVFAAKVLHLVS